MVFVFDSTILLLVLDPKAGKPTDRQTGKPVDRPIERVENFIDTCSRRSETILIPTPVLTEVLILGGPDLQERLDMIKGQARFRIVEFHELAAIEAAYRLKIPLTGRKDRAEKARIKFDQQILSIALTENAKVLCTDDHRLQDAAIREGLTTLATAQMPLSRLI